MDILITADEYARAPRLVREWIDATISAQLGLARNDGLGGNGLEQLVALSAEQAAALLEEIRNDYVACQVFFELGRSGADEGTEPDGWHRLPLLDIMHHTRLADPSQVLAVLERISEAFRLVGDEDAPLFAIDQASNLRLRRQTQRSIQALWRRIVAEQYAELADAHPQGPSVPLAARPLPGGLDV